MPPSRKALGSPRDACGEGQPPWPVPVPGLVTTLGNCRGDLASWQTQGCERADLDQGDDSSCPVGLCRHEGPEKWVGVGEASEGEVPQQRGPEVRHPGFDHGRPDVGTDLPLDAPGSRDSARRHLDSSREAVLTTGTVLF